MKKTLVALVLLLAFTAAAFAIDGATGLGEGKSKIELGYVGSGFGIQYDLGLSSDWTVYAALSGVSGLTGIGIGTKYAILNERKGDSISLAPKVDVLLGAGGTITVPGIVLSKKINSSTTVLGEAYSWSAGLVNMSWLGGGIVYNVTDKIQLAGELGIATVAVDFMGYNFSGSGIGFGLGANFLL